MDVRMNGWIGECLALVDKCMNAWMNGLMDDHDLENTNDNCIHFL